MPEPVNLTYYVPEDLRWDSEIIKAFLECAPYHLHGMRPEVSGRNILVSGVPEKPLPGSAYDIVGSVVTSLVRGYRDVTSRLLGEHASKRVYAKIDPFETLIDQGAIRQSSAGVFNYGGTFLAAMRSVDALISNFAQSLGAVEEAYPSTVPTTSLVRAGYLKSFPHHALLVAPIQYNRHSIEAAQTLDLSAGENRSQFVSQLGNPSCALAPTVCHHTFNARKDSKISKSETITAENLCHRFEAENVNSLERLMTFRMREIVFFGSAEHIRNMLDTCFDWFQKLLIQLDVSFRATTANDPFFGNSSDSKRLFQTIGMLKREVHLHIPATDRWIAVASFNNHAESLVGAFAIHGEEGQDLQSGCVGFGIERLLYGLFCAFGTSEEHWPESVFMMGVGGSAPK